MAEDGGFEPPRVLSQHDFQSCALGHYANPPRVRLLEGEPPPEIVALQGARCHDREVRNEPEAFDDGWPSAVGTAAAVAPTADSSLSRVRATLAGLTYRRVIGWALLAGWAVWLVALWVAQPRLVSPELLAADLAQGRVTAYRAVTVDRDAGGMFSPAYRIELLPTSGEGLDVGEDGRPATIAYWVDAPVGALRVLDPDKGWSDAAATAVQDLAGAAVPEADMSTFYLGPPAQRTYNAGALLLLLTFVMVVAGPRPRRGTRWFWFWLLAVPLAAVVPLFAVAELLRPRYEMEGAVPPPGVAGRWSGLTGFATGVVASLLVGGVLLALSDVSPVLFVRG